MTLSAFAEPAVADDDDIDLDLALARTRAGDHDAFAVLYDRLAPRVFALLVALLRDEDRARCEELLQSVFHEVWTRAQEGTAPQFSAEPWVLALAHRHAVELAA